MKDTIKPFFPKGDLDQQNTLDRSLRVACKEGDLQQVKNWISAGANIHSRPNFRSSALHVAAEHGRLEICQFLVQSGVCLESEGEMGRRPLHWAAAEGHADVCSFLIEQGALVDSRVPAGATALHLAAQENKADVCLLLIGLGASLDLESSGATPATMARRFKHHALADQIKSAGESRQASDAIHHLMEGHPVFRGNGFNSCA